jgi:glycerophosphoryl diester phosphodiesterase
VEITEGFDMGWILSAFARMIYRRHNAQFSLMPIKPFFRASRPQVFAHRGGCALGPENTLAAFDLGMAAGADGLELDVHLSADGIVVVHHDETLDRTTNGAGPLARLTAAELAAVDAGFHFDCGGGRFGFRGQGVGIPTLREVLRRYPGVPIIIEMKVDAAEMGEGVAAEVRRADAVDRVCVAGFGPQAVRAARAAIPEMASSACAPEVRLALYRSWIHWPVRQVPYGGYQVPEVAGGHRIVSRRFIGHAHAAALRVQVWTVDERADMDRLLSWGADALISNCPDRAVVARDAFCRG